MIIRKVTILWLVSLNSLFVFGQFTYFNNHYNNDNWSAGISIVETGNGYVAFGVSGQAVGQNIFKRVLLTLIDHQGNQVWWKTYGEDFHNYYAGLTRGGIKTSDGGFAISGSIEDATRSVGLLMKFDENGDSLWSRIYGDTIIPGYSFNGFYTCQQLPDQGYLLVGTVYVSGDDGDILLVRTDSLGNQQWRKTYGDLHMIETGYSLAQLPDKGFIVGYMSQDLDVFYTYHPGILKVDSLGNEKWRKLYSGPYDDSGSAITLSQDSNYLLGSTYGCISTHPLITTGKVWIIKTDTSGTVIWDKKYTDTTFYGQALTIDQLGNGDIIISGNGSFADGFGIYGWIVKTDSEGDSLWMRRYGLFPTDDNEQNDLAFTSDNGIITTGMAMGEPDWTEFIWIQKLDSIGCDSAGCDTTVGIVQYPPAYAGNEKISIYPNPASDWLHFQFHDVQPNFFSNREIEIYNVFGEKVAEAKLPRLVDGYDQNVLAFASGLYLVIVKERQRVVFSSKVLIAR